MKNGKGMNRLLIKKINFRLENFAQGNEKWKRDERAFDKKMNFRLENFSQGTRTYSWCPELKIQGGDGRPVACKCRSVIPSTKVNILGLCIYDAQCSALAYCMGNLRPDSGRFGLRTLIMTIDDFFGGIISAG